MDHVPVRATAGQLHAFVKRKKMPTIRGPGIEDEHDFEAFIEFANRVNMDDEQFNSLLRLVEKHVPRIPMYVCTIKKSKVVKNKAKKYFSKRFTVNHIVTNVQLPAEIKVYSRNAKVAKVKMVMSRSKAKGKAKGGAMIISNWMDVVKQNGIRVNDKYVFWFLGSRDGGLKLLVDLV
ncbi:hypothetical protein ACQ4PT_041273 [Festuca glaucescens]